MKQMANKKIAILNLCSELSSELEDYFIRKQILLANHESLSPAQGWTHILTKGVENFSEIEETYATKEKGIKIISLSPVEDLEDFASSSGKLIFDELWMQNNLGAFILDKFFQEYGGVAIKDSYPTFKEKGSFHITNPFNTGEYLDRLVYSAFSDGFSALSIKTYFDHLIMFLTGLKKQGKLGLPIEVSYGNFEDVFGIQLNFLSQNFNLEDVTASMSKEVSKDVDKYLLNITTRSCDFFDFTLLNEVNKTVITGLWTKDDRIRSEGRGLLLNELTTGAAITQYPTEGITSFQASNPVLEDFSDQVTVSSGPGQKNEETRVSGLGDENVAITTLATGPKEEAYSQLVKGQKSTEEEHKTVLSGTEKEEDLITLVKGSIEEEKEEVFKFSSEKKAFDVDKFAFRVSSNLDQKSKKDDALKITSLKDQLPESIKEGFHEFAARLNKSVDDLTEEDLENFKDNEVPKIIKDTTKKVDNSRWTVSSLGQLPPMEQVSNNDKGLELKIKALNNENENLKNKMKTLLAEVRILKDSKSQMAEVNMKASMVAEASTIHQSESLSADAALRDQMMQKLNGSKELNTQDLTKLSALLEREGKYLDKAKEEGMQLKRMQIEATQKESFFTQELEKMNRQLKARDLVVTKTKESFSKLVGQKDQEIKILHEKLDAAAKVAATANNQNQAQTIRDLERKVINHEKMIEIYKAKITEKPAVATEDVAAKEENRKLQMLNNQMKNQLDIAKKDAAKYQAKATQDMTTITALKADKVKLEQELKKASFDAKKDEAAAVAHQNMEKEMKRLQGTVEAYEAQLKESQNKQRDLEARLQDALKNQKKEATVAEDPVAAKGKTAQLENNVRKLTQDLVESRNQLAEMKKETNKLRQEKTALQNHLDKAKRDAEKAAAAAPKKPGMGGKAA